MGGCLASNFLKSTKHIRSKLDYANSITCPFIEEDVQLLERVQRKALKLMKWTFSEKHLIGDMVDESDPSDESPTILRTNYT
jgi:hypothetical protein